MFGMLDVMLDREGTYLIKGTKEGTYQLLEPRNTGNWQDDIGRWDFVCESEQLEDLREKARATSPYRTRIYYLSSNFIVP